MNTKQFYAQLKASLQENEIAAVVSRYEGANLEVSKEISTPSDPEGWQEVEAFWANPEAKTNGPVCSIRSGDSLTVIERYTAKPRLIILGGGHIALALTEMAALLDFEIIVFDDRPSFANPARFPKANSVICDSFTKLFERLPVRSTDFVVIATRGHKHDTNCLHGILAGSEPMYTGMIGSRRRVAIVMDQLREAGHASERIEAVHSPIGLRIGAFTPAEIAISILAEIIQVRRQSGLAQKLSSCDLEVVEALATDAADTMQAMITIFDTDGSVPIDCGAKLAMSYEGSILGTIGGGCSEADAMQVARELIRHGGWRTHTIDMSDSAEEDGMVCGGQMQVVIEKL